jgi:hypothetical protein
LRNTRGLLRVGAHRRRPRCGHMRCSNDRMRLRFLLPLLVLAVGCASETGVEEEDVGVDEAELAKGGRLCIDTNDSTLDTNYAKAQKRSCVGRYLSFDGEHPALTREEARRLKAGGMDIFAIWEVSKYRPIEGGSTNASHRNGIADAKAAKAKMAEVGGGNNPVYFTVDFDLSPTEWAKSGPKVLAYFEGINSIMGVKRTGAYGTYVTIKELFDHGKIAYGWQMTFGNKGKKVDPRAQLRQHDIYPDQTGWGVSGAGALDLDRAVKGDFGQW